ncbi:MAG: LysE family translocator [Sulfurovaceae bacterium]|nr:LysE family translocator [Sulfurovaceae bacterium]MDD5549375.1 LysE family translocator [Sulfurovaceae bacterium]
MIDSFLQGFLLGLGAAVPIGPINILIMNQALKNYKNSVAIGFGAMSADITYIVVIFFGLLTFASDKSFMQSLGVLGTIFLFVMTYVIFKNRNNNLSTKEKSIKATKIYKFYLGGFFLTMLNPYTIGFWLSVSSYSLNKNLDYVMTFLGLIFAILLWITMMPFFVHKSRHKISPKIAYYINLTSAVILLCFGISLVYSTFK